MGNAVEIPDVGENRDATTSQIQPIKNPDLFGHGVLVAATTDGTMSIFCPDDSIEETESVLMDGFNVATDGILAVEPLSKGLVAMGCQDNKIHILDLQQVRILSTLEGHSHWVRDLSFFLSESLLASASDDNSIRLWKLQWGEGSEECPCVAQLTEHADSVVCVKIREDAWPNHLLSASGDRTGRIWDLEKTSQIGVLSGHRKFVLAIDVDSGGELIATGSGDGSVRLWDARTLEQESIVDVGEPVGSLILAAAGITGTETSMVVGSKTGVSLYDSRNLSGGILRRWESEGNVVTEIDGTSFGNVGVNSCSVMKYDDEAIRRSWTLGDFGINTISYIPPLTS